ncbi:hypothetical protein L2E82_01509 [Cichorium intybus]|uniref:Uncharacterized protein n=1 Tax=Cichorium intybus TaxID=13427 RepID=A0ACB9GZS9_CICIN|nr:hypothetical protein L2E82_01509 [Cichorium intybus]
MMYMSIRAHMKKSEPNPLHLIYLIFWLVGWYLLFYLLLSEARILCLCAFNRYGTDRVGNLTNLQQLYIGYYNGYTGGIPPEIGNLSSLIRLDAANCGLSGELPPKIGKLQNLDTLFLQVNRLSGSLTKDLGSLKSLK